MLGQFSLTKIMDFHIFYVHWVLFGKVISATGKNVPITPECQRYCDSKRKYGTTAPFIANCGLKISHGLGQCAGDCYDNKCPGHLCPKKYDIHCPAGISLQSPPSTTEKSSGWKSPKAIGITAAVFAVLLITCGIISCFVRCHVMKTRRRVNRAQHEDYENEPFPVIVQVPASQPSPTAGSVQNSARLGLVDD